MPCSLDVRVLADLLEDGTAATLDISAVLLPIDTVVFPHILCLGLGGACIVRVGGIWIRLPFPT